MNNSLSLRRGKIATGISVAEVSLPTTEAIEIERERINHVFSCDVSGSMYGSLSKMRQQLKNRIPDLISENDTISIIWFSGRRQAGILKERVQVKNLTDLKLLNDAIDRFLVPVGLTSFLDPVQLYEGILESDKDGRWSFIFLSDGYNNESPWSEVISTLERVADRTTSATIIEYGYYADSAKLTEMAEVLGGTKIFSADFDSYEIEMEKVLAGDVLPRKSVDISSIKDDMKFQFMWCIDEVNKSVKVYSTARNTSIQVPVNVSVLYYVSKTSGKEKLSHQPYASMAYILADRMKYDLLDEVIYHIFDDELYSQFEGAFGKQRLNDLKDRLLEIAFTEDYAISSTNKPKRGKDIFSLFDLLALLDSEEGNLIYPSHPAFEYTRIGRKSVQKKILSEDDRKKLAESGTVNDAKKVLEEVKGLVFTPKDPMQGYGISNLTWNQERANLSLLFRIEGSVDLPKNPYGLTNVPTFIFRNYAVIKDGIQNISTLPVTLSKNTVDKLPTNVKLISTGTHSNEGKEIFVIDFSELPIINRKMTTNVSSVELSSLEIENLYNQVARKYLSYLKSGFEKSDSAFKSQYSKEAAEWLNSLGITSYQGFSPKTELAESTDFYMAPTLETKISKFSSIPKIETILQKRKESKSLTVSEQLLSNIMNSIDQEVEKQSTPNERKRYISNEYDVRNKTSRGIIRNIAKLKFSLILSRKWFSDLKEFEINKVNYNDFEITYDFTEKPVKL